MRAFAGILAAASLFTAAPAAAGVAFGAEPSAAPQAEPAAPVAAPDEPAPASSERRVRAVLSVVLEHQPDEFLTVQFADGETKDLGSFIAGLHAGAAFAVTPDRKWELQGTIGARFTSVEASNGDIDFRDFPLELTGHVNLGNFRLGAGPTVHFGGKLSGSGVAAPIDAEFDSAVGALGVVEYRAQKVGLGLRYSWLDLDVKGGGSIDASSFGALFALYL